MANQSESLRHQFVQHSIKKYCSTFQINKQLLRSKYDFQENSQQSKSPFCETMYQRPRAIIVPISQSLSCRLLGGPDQKYSFRYMCSNLIYSSLNKSKKWQFLQKQSQSNAPAEEHTQLYKLTSLQPQSNSSTNQKDSSVVLEKCEKHSITATIEDGSLNVEVLNAEKEDESQIIEKQEQNKNIDCQQQYKNMEQKEEEEKNNNNKEDEDNEQEREESGRNSSEQQKQYIQKKQEDENEEAEANKNKQQKVKVQNEDKDCDKKQSQIDEQEVEQYKQQQENEDQQEQNKQQQQQQSQQQVQTVEQQQNKEHKKEQKKQDEKHESDEQHESNEQHKQQHINKLEHSIKEASDIIDIDNKESQEIEQQKQEDGCNQYRNQQPNQFKCEKPVVVVTYEAQTNLEFEQKMSCKLDTSKNNGQQLVQAVKSNPEVASESSFKPTQLNTQDFIKDCQQRTQANQKKQYIKKIWQKYNKLIRNKLSPQSQTLFRTPSSSSSSLPWPQPSSDSHWPPNDTLAHCCNPTQLTVIWIDAQSPSNSQIMLRWRKQFNKQLTLISSSELKMQIKLKLIHQYNTQFVFICSNSTFQEVFYNSLFPYGNCFTYFIYCMNLKIAYSNVNKYCQGIDVRPFNQGYMFQKQVSKYIANRLKDIRKFRKQGKS